MLNLPAASLMRPLGSVSAGAGTASPLLQFSLLLAFFGFVHGQAIQGIKVI